MSKQNKNGISWTDETWNPIVGCLKISDGCKNCWAEKAAILHYNDLFPGGWFGTVMPYPDRLEQPLHWKKPRKIAVGLMGDLFHEDIDDSFLDQVFAVMRDCPQHTYQILTKRPKRMLSYLTENVTIGGCLMRHRSPDWIWLGVSCENQPAADERIPLLMKTPAAVRFVSAEPLLGSLYLPEKALCPCSCYAGHPRNPHPDCAGQATIDWVIVGGESGTGARPIHPDWVRGIRDQCQGAGVPFHFKQWGEWVDYTQIGACEWEATECIGTSEPKGVVRFDDGRQIGPFPTQYPFSDEWTIGPCMVRVGKKAAGHMLDGREWQEFPERVK